MNNPALSLQDFSRTKSGSRRTAGIAFVGVLHIAAIWALMNGLMVRIAAYIPPVVHMRVIDTPQQQHPVKPLPPPDPTFTSPVHRDDVPEPVIKFTSDTGATPIHTTLLQTQTQTVVADTAASGIAGTHSIPPYPPVSTRLGQQGVVVLNLSIGTDGSVTDAQVATSSGFAELDRTALSWVTAHWRYKPALHAGMPVASQIQAAVRFDLKDMR